ncbi:hypothetical protein [Pelotomaculum propionicicum]|uniref:Uncharacterized protein n=1 Tax=Pelotomaculum propionicicum TaxID=258475 RepID=A0A4Y7RJK3_9FIRM|nr:hypothetical protein [Pelotomaculum propionicicum]TEB09165.1 hypothetical protein Pmgp_03340 [Pelotomaculum propionicicum]
MIDRAVLACKNSGFEVNDHFAEVSKMVEMPQNAKKHASSETQRKS